MPAPPVAPHYGQFKPAAIARQGRRSVGSLHPYDAMLLIANCARFIWARAYFVSNPGAGLVLQQARRGEAVQRPRAAAVDRQARQQRAPEHMLLEGRRGNLTQ